MNSTEIEASIAQTADAREIFLGDWLAHFNLGPTEAAKIAGCSQGYISNIKAGRKKNINALYLLKISEHLGVTINDFFRPLPSTFLGAAVFAASFIVGMHFSTAPAPTPTLYFQPNTPFATYYLRLPAQIGTVRGVY